MARFVMLFGLVMQVMAAPTPNLFSRASPPTAKSVRIIGNVTDPAVNRDSCGSVRIGSRALWTCRDTQTWNYASNSDNNDLVPSTASWSDVSSRGPVIQSGGAVGVGSTGSNDIHLMYGGQGLSLPAYYPLSYGECPESGVCSDDTRWAIWPDSPPLITNTSPGGAITAYTFIPLAHLNGLELLNPNPSFSLYKTTYTPNNDKTVLPTVSLVAQAFFQPGQIGFGNYGGVVSNGYAYLYGQTSSPNVGTTLARVPIGSIESLPAYEYYVNGAWTKQMPGINDADAIIPNAGAGGQGTFYYSTYLEAYVWIGQAANINQPVFMITTAQNPEGPWQTPVILYEGLPGNNPIAGGYSLQAHPALLPSTDASENGIYLTYTQPWPNNYYVTPLIWVEFN